MEVKQFSQVTLEVVEGSPAPGPLTLGRRTPPPPLCRVLQRALRGRQQPCAGHAPAPVVELLDCGWKKKLGGMQVLAGMRWKV